MNNNSHILYYHKEIDELADDMALLVSEGINMSL